MTKRERTQMSVVDTKATATAQTNIVNIRPMEPEPAYIKLYIQDLSKIFHLQQGHQEILTYVAASVDYEGIVSLAIGRKARIAATIKCSVKSVDNAITEFVRHGILDRIGRGEYELNPFLFAKGEWRNIRDRRKLFKMTRTYQPDGNVMTETTFVDVAEHEQQAKLKFN